MKMSLIFAGSSAGRVTTILADESTRVTDEESSAMTDQPGRLTDGSHVDHRMEPVSTPTKPVSSRTEPVFSGSGYDTSQAGLDLDPAGYGFNPVGNDLSPGGYDLSQGGYDLSQGGYDLSQGGYDLSSAGFDHSPAQTETEEPFSLLGDSKIPILASSDRKEYSLGVNRDTNLNLFDIPSIVLTPADRGVDEWSWSEEDEGPETKSRLLITKRNGLNDIFNSGESGDVDIKVHASIGSLQLGK
jgi:hypothetical protein